MKKKTIYYTPSMGEVRSAFNNFAISLDALEQAVKEICGERTIKRIIKRKIEIQEEIKNAESNEKP